MTSIICLAVLVIESHAGSPMQGFIKKGFQGVGAFTYFTLSSLNKYIYIYIYIYIGWKLSLKGWQRGLFLYVGFLGFIYFGLRVFRV